MRIVFMGSPEFAAKSLVEVQKHHEVALVVSQPSRPKGRGKKLQMPAVAIAATELGLPLVQPKKVRDGSFAKLCVEQNADVGVVVAYGRILPLGVLEAFPHGCLNVHASLLPKYRGAAPIQRAVMNGDDVTGVSIMRLEEGLDTGPVMLQKTCGISPIDTSSTMFNKLAEIGADALVESLRKLEEGTAEFIAQDHDQATLASMLEKSEGQVDWNLPATEVSARMRGVDPWPGAQANLAGSAHKLFAPLVVESSGSPGTIMQADERLIVACGSDAIEIREIQAPGRKRVAASDYLRGAKISVGDRFGD